MRVVDAHGEARLEALTLEEIGTGRREDVAAAAVFILIGAEPRTEWLDGVVARDERGFVMTGRDLCPEPWSLERQPLPFETSQAFSRSGTFATARSCASLRPSVRGRWLSVPYTGTWRRPVDTGREPAKMRHRNDALPLINRRWRSTSGDFGYLALRR
jgi:hypothetical protein